MANLHLITPQELKVAKHQALQMESFLKKEPISSLLEESAIKATSNLKDIGYKTNLILSSTNVDVVIADYEAYSSKQALYFTASTERFIDRLPSIRNKKNGIVEVVIPVVDLQKFGIRYKAYLPSMYYGVIEMAAVNGNLGSYNENNVFVAFDKKTLRKYRALISNVVRRLYKTTTHKTSVVRWESYLNKDVYCAKIDAAIRTSCFFVMQFMPVDKEFTRSEKSALLGYLNKSEANRSKYRSVSKHLPIPFIRDYISPFIIKKMMERANIKELRFTKDDVVITNPHSKNGEIRYVDTRSNTFILHIGFFMMDSYCFAGGTDGYHIASYNYASGNFSTLYKIYKDESLTERVKFTELLETCGLFKTVYRYEKSLGYKIDKETGEAEWDNSQKGLSNRVIIADDIRKLISTKIREYYLSEENQDFIENEARYQKLKNNLHGKDEEKTIEEIVANSVDFSTISEAIDAPVKKGVNFFNNYYLIDPVKKQIDMASNAAPVSLLKFFDGSERFSKTEIHQIDMILLTNAVKVYKDANGNIIEALYDPSLAETVISSSSRIYRPLTNLSKRLKRIIFPKEKFINLDLKTAHLSISLKILKQIDETYEKRGINVKTFAGYSIKDAIAFLESYTKKPFDVFCIENFGKVCPLLKPAALAQFYGAGSGEIINYQEEEYIFNSEKANELVQEAHYWASRNLQGFQRYNFNRVMFNFHSLFKLIDVNRGLIKDKFESCSKKWLKFYYNQESKELRNKSKSIVIGFSSFRRKFFSGELTVPEQLSRIWCAAETMIQFKVNEALHEYRDENGDRLFELVSTEHDGCVIRAIKGDALSYRVLATQIANKKIDEVLEAMGLESGDFPAVVKEF